MLTRIFTGLGLLIFLAILLFKSNNIIFNIFLYLAIFLCSKEWGKISKLPSFCLVFNGIYLSIIVIYIFVNVFYFEYAFYLINYIKYFAYIIINLTPLWLIVFLTVLSSSKCSNNNIFLYFLGFFIFTNFGVTVLDIKYNPYNYDGSLLLMSLIFITAINDSGAYFTGKFFGKTKLAAKISPNKTVEGLLGGITISLFFSIVLYYYIFNQKINIITWLIGIVIVLVSANLGDLVESQLKRNAKIKDSGNILPGHGGILDRLDSHLVVIPMFWYLMVNFTT